MYKRFLSTLLVLSLTLTMLPVGALAEELGGLPEDLTLKTVSGMDGGSQLYAAGTITEHTLDNGAVLKFDSDTGTITDCVLNGATSVDVPAELDGVTVRALGARSFEELRTLESVVLPDTIESIGDSAFSNALALTAIAIPDSVKLIDRLAFNRCEKLASVTFGEDPQLEHIGAMAFFMCGFSSFEIPQSIKQLDNDIFYQCTKLESIAIPETVETINSEGWFQNCYKLSHVVLPSHMTELGARIFRGCSSLTKENVDIPEGITRIGDEAFMSCSGFDSITIPEGVTYIGKKAFWQCTGLTEIVIPKNVTYLGGSDGEVFAQSTNLRKIEILGPVTELGEHSFSNCRSLKELILPDTLKTIGKNAFNSCNALPTVELPEGLETIGDSAFVYCNALTELTLPASVQTVGENAIGSSLYNNILRKLTVLGIGTTFGEGNLAHVPEDFVMYGHAGSPAEAYATENDLTFRTLDQMSRVLSVKVTAPDDTMLSEDFTVTWYDGDGNEAGEGVALQNADATKSYAVQVTLTGTLAAQYAQPERKTFLPEDPAEWVCRLVPLDTVTVTGRVVGKDQTALAGAAVTIAQNGVEQTAATAADGTFSLTPVKTVVTVTVSADGHYTRRFTVDLSQQTALGDIALTELVTDRLMITANVAPAALEGESPSSAALSSLEGLAFTVTKGSAPIELEVQGTSLIFVPDSVGAGDTVTVTVADTRGKYAVPSPVTVTLDGEKVGYCELTLTEKGGIRLGTLGSQDARLMIFDAGGKGVFTGQASAYQTVSALDAGTYTVVLMAQDPLIGGVPTLAQLSAFGLAQGTDYFQASVTVADGKIAQVADTTVPALDVGKLSVTKSASVKTNKPDGTIPGGSFLVRADFELDEGKLGEAQALELAIPDGISVSGNVALVDNMPVTFDSSGKTVSVPVTGKASAVVYLYCEAGPGTGEFSISAALRLAGGGSQPIGTAVARVRNARIDVPDKTGRTTIAASGKGAANSDVAVYDNGVVIANTRTNAIGNWTAELDLTKAGKVYSYSYHDIYAVIGTGAGALTTDTATVIYDSRAVSLKRLTFITNGQKKVVDYADGITNDPAYYYYSVSEPAFTFKAEFEGDAELKEVYILTKNNAGEATYVPAAYDASQNAWIATHDYRSAYESPALFGVAYTPAELPAPSAGGEMWTEFYEDIGNVAPEEYDVVKAVFDTDMPVSVEEGDRLTIRYDDETKTLGTVSSELTDLTVTGTELEQQGFVSLGDGKYIKYSGDGGSLYISIADTAAGKVEAKTVAFSASADDAGDRAAQAGRAAMAQQPLARDASVGDVVGLIDTVVQNLPDDDGFLKKQKDTVGTVATITSAAEIGSNIGKLMALTEKHYRDLVKKEKEVRKLLEAVSCKGDPLLDELSREAFLAQFPELETDVRGPLKQYKLESFYTGCTIAVSNIYFLTEMATQQISGKGLLGSLAVGEAVSKLNGYVYDTVTKFINHRYEVISKYYDDLAARIRAGYKKDDDCGPEPDPEVESPLVEIKDIDDPSGYVYEAVPSNRLAGVTATIYQDESGTESQWDAQRYDQVNPQITAEDGRFQWDVPQGKWKVKLSKDGYTPADSSQAAAARGYADGWLIVAPPQYEIDIGMVSTRAPSVEGTIAYTDRAEVLFSQYMDIDSVKRSLSLTADGAGREIAVQPLDEEADLSGEKTYARRFAVVPVEGELSQGVVVSVAAEAENYAGTALGGYTSQSMSAIARPTGIKGPDSVSLALTDGSPSVTVTLLPGLSGRDLTVESLAPEILDVQAPQVTTDGDGNAAVGLTLKLPGSAKLKVTEPVSGLTLTIPVKAALERPAPVTVHLEDGSTVSSGATLEPGTKLTLRTAESGAVIRYTLNDTCPCKEAALVYSAPLTITENTILRAAAYKDGTYSSTIRLELNVEASGGNAPSGLGNASGDPSYRLDNDKGSGENGSWSTDRSSAKKGDIVTITVKPNEGFQGTPSVKDKNGDEIDLRDLGGGKYSFTMPDSSVSISVTFSPVAPAGPFTDLVEGTYYYDAVQWAVENGITTGTSATTFSPDAPCTRAEIVTFLWRAAGSPAAEGEDPFTDVPRDSYYYDAVLWAVSQGITVGTSATTFSPNTFCTRAQAVTFLYRAAGCPAALGEIPFADVVSGAYYTDAVQWAVSKGVTVGSSPTTFSPDRDCSRAQIVTFLYRDRTGKR